MTRRVARAALAYAAVGARARVCEVTIQVDGAGVGLAFADDVELDAAVRGFVARFALPLDQMGCADDGCAVEYIKAHARLNAACDAAPYGDAAASDVDAASGASYALYALEAALGAAQLFAASRDAPASPLRETLLWVLLHSSERAFESHGLGKQWAYAALVQLWVALTPDDPGPSAGAVGVLFQIWATHAFAGAEKAGLGREVPHVLAALRDLARPASVSRVDLCKPDDTVGDVEAFVAASVSVAKITTLDCATDEDLVH
ncbi:hypothetical protein JL720_12195 [Aureococcus anophagefferens]|nr:hypothetical protein JL720_12195 [Aureococcus anophagefferens]